MLISATMVITYAADSQQTSSISYTSLSPEEKNIYEINIPSDISVDGNGGSFQITMNEGYQLEDDYQVAITLDKSSFYVQNFTSSSVYHLRLYLDGARNSPYYYEYKLTNNSGSPIDETRSSVVTFRTTGTTNGDGTVKITRDTTNSTDKNYKEAGNFTGNLVFNIVGSYY